MTSLTGLSPYKNPPRLYCQAQNDVDISDRETRTDDQAKTRKQI